jgi:SAM-dependent methyltransferase
MIEAAELRVDPRISPGDGMLGGNEKHYFSVGRSALIIIKRALDASALASAGPARILDFPCGHGRVLRYLRAAFPHAEITACDLLTDGVDFCAKTLGATGVYSDPEPSRIALPRDCFDLIWVGSLFTHFDARQWKTFLTFFRDLLSPNGLLVFSTQGRHSHHCLADNVCTYDLDPARRSRLLHQLETSGFGYVDYSGSCEYGISIAEPAWVCRLITSVPDLRVIQLCERSWDDHHDIYACVRDVAWKAPCTLEPGSPIFQDRSFPYLSRAKALVPWKLWWNRSA